VAISREERREERRGEKRGEERRAERNGSFFPPHPKFIKARLQRQIGIRYDTAESVWTHRTGSLTLG